MTMIRSASRFLVILTLGLAACAYGSVTENPCPLTIPPVSGWTTYDEGDFTVQLPPDFMRVRVQGIDSQVGRWESEGKSVSYDLGAYANPLQQNELNSFPGLTVCQESDDRGAPRIIRYQSKDGGYGISAHWPDLRQQGLGMVESLTLDGIVEQAEDQGETLAIIRSAQIESR